MKRFECGAELSGGDYIGTEIHEIDKLYPLSPDLSSPIGKLAHELASGQVLVYTILYEDPDLLLEFSDDKSCTAEIYLWERFVSQGEDGEPVLRFNDKPHKTD